MLLTGMSMDIFTPSRMQAGQRLNNECVERANYFPEKGKTVIILHGTLT